MTSFIEELENILRINGLSEQKEIKAYLKEIEKIIEIHRHNNANIENRENKEMRDIYNYDLIFKYITDTQNDNS